MFKTTRSMCWGSWAGSLSPCDLRKARKVGIHSDSCVGVICELEGDLAVQVVGRDGLGEPDSVLRFEELEAVGLHEAGCDLENDGFAMFSSYFMSNADISAQLDVLAGHLGEPLALDRIHEAGAGAMVEELGWRFSGELNVDIDRMTLGSANAIAVFREEKALFTLLNDRLKTIAREDFTIFFKAGEKVVDFCPALGVEF